MPPYLAGREAELVEFSKLLEQRVILENLILTGLRGVGKTVLLESFKPLAVESGWLWVGTDLSEAASVSEENLATRILTDLSVVTSTLSVPTGTRPGFGTEPSTAPVTFDTLAALYSETPGLPSDRLKAVLEAVWVGLNEQGTRGVIFAYDEAQNLADRPEKEQYPLSLLLDVFQSIQRKEIPYLLVLAGLPTLFPKLVEARTFSERMFRVMTLDRLTREASREAIVRPIEADESPMGFDETSVELICEWSGGYPYFIQFICREVFDIFIQQTDRGVQPGVPIEAIVRKLDSDFFSGRWAKPTDRQRDLLRVIAGLDRSDSEFTIQEVVDMSAKVLSKPFTPSHVNQILVRLSEMGLIYKNRYGKYSFAVPLFGQFILREMERERNPQARLF